MQTDYAAWIKWTPSTDNTGVSGYIIWRDGVQVATTSIPEYQDKNMLPSTQYIFSVVAVDAAGNQSGQSNWAITSLDPIIPSRQRWWGNTSNKPPADNIAPIISGTPPTEITINSPYTFAATAHDTDNDTLRFSINKLPDWASFHGKKGTLSGTPTSNDIGTTTNIIISVTDGLATRSLPAFNLTVSAETGSAGKVLFLMTANSKFDIYSKDPSAEQQEWIRDNYYRMLTYSPYFDSRISWYPNAMVYRDAYAMYRDSDIAAEHPEWVLRDTQGNMLYIPYGCSGGSCPQYAADIGNPAFRQWWIHVLGEKLALGYRGVFIDDVNLAWRVGNGEGDSITPIDARTGTQMTFSDYQRYWAEFLEQIRSTFPDAEIAHNAIWFAQGAEDDDQYIARQISAADYYFLERGVNDGGLRGGDGRWGFETFLAYIDYIHSLGTNIILDDNSSTSVQSRDYELAAYFLVNNGYDYLSADGDRSNTSPDNFWQGYNVNLGIALGERFKQNGLIRRDFECGLALVNQPEEPDRTINLGETFYTIEGAAVNSVTLVESSGAVLLRSCAMDTAP